MVVVPYVKGRNEAFARILKSHGIATANHLHRTLRNFVVHPKDKVKDEEKTELIYRVPCKNCSSSYAGETGRKIVLRIKEHKKELDSFTAGTQTRASRARETMPWKRTMSSTGTMQKWSTERHNDRPDG